MGETIKVKALLGVVKRVIPKGLIMVGMDMAFRWDFLIDTPAGMIIAPVAASPIVQNQVQDAFSCIKPLVLIAQEAGEENDEEKAEETQEPQETSDKPTGRIVSIDSAKKKHG